MEEAKTLQKRKQTTGEEIANSISHGVGLLGAIAAIPILVIFLDSGKDSIDLAGVLVFAISMVLLYLASTMYHALPSGKTKRVFQIMDHTAIFILIAGTYTPFALSTLRGPWGWSLFGLIWILAIIGIGLELAGKFKSGKYSNILYLAMGWAGVLVIKPLINNMPTQGLIWLAIGGLFYTFGVYFYAKDRKRYFHFVWHFFVLAGSVSHFFAVLWYA
jgi:hemolysin III